MNRKNKICNARSSFCHDQSGAIAVIVAICIVVFLGMAALVVDIGYMMMSRNQSQNAADSGALAGARKMGQNYLAAISPDSGVSASAQGAATANKVTTENLAADNVDVRLGEWKPATKSFEETSVNPHAVQVVTRRQDGLTSGPISTFFAPVLGKTNYNMAAKAVASLTGTCTAEVPIPLSIGRSWFTNLHANAFCTQIALNDTTQSCAGWTNLSTNPYKQADVQKILENRDPTKLTTVHSGDSIELGGGTTTPILNDLIDAFNSTTWDAAHKTIVEGVVQDWTVQVVVTEDGGVCDNPNTERTVLGFATIKITGIVTTGSNKGPVGEVECEKYVEGPGGCFYAGTYGAIPNLVQ